MSLWVDFPAGWMHLLDDWQTAELQSQRTCSTVCPVCVGEAGRGPGPWWSWWSIMENIVLEVRHLTTASNVSCLQPMRSQSSYSACSICWGEAWRGNENTPLVSLAVRRRQCWLQHTGRTSPSMHLLHTLRDLTFNMSGKNYMYTTIGMGKIRPGDQMLPPPTLLPSLNYSMLLFFSWGQKKHV